MLKYQIYKLAFHPAFSYPFFMRYRLSILFIIPVLFITSCTSISNTELADFQKIGPIPGSEDMEAAVIDGQNVIIISSAYRGPAEGPDGGIMAYMPDTGELFTFDRDDYLESFNPHGISIYQNKTVFVINHFRTEKLSKHQILIYDIDLKSQSLRLQSILEHELLESPNDLKITTDGVLYICNDRSRDGGIMEMLLGLKKSKVAAYNLNTQEWFVAVDKIAMANGVEETGGKLYIAATRENKIYQFDIEKDYRLTGKKVFAEVTGPDNFSWDGEYLYIAGHIDDFAFMNYIGSKDSLSPTVISRIDPVTGKTAVIYQEDGRNISASSVAIRHKEDLILGQVARDFIVRITLP